MPRLLRFLAPLVLLSLSLGACGSTVTILGQWRDPDYKQHFKKVLVVGLSDRALYRRLYEDEFVERFQKAGVQAVASYTLVGGDETPELEALKAAIEGKGFDGAMLTHLIDIKRTQEHHEGPSTSRTYVSSYMGYGYGGYHPYYNSFGTYYSVVADYTHLPGYYTETRNYNLETALYELEGKELVWALTTRTVDPEKIMTVLDALADEVFAEMGARGLP